MGVQRATGLAMRIAIFFYFCIGIALIAFGCTLQNPPADYAPGMFVAVGSLNLFASLAGFWGSYNKKRVLMVFIIFGGISTLLQIIFTITLHTMFDKALDAIKKGSNLNEKESEKLGKQLNIMRWVMLGFLFVELLTLVLAILLKWVIKDDSNEYKGFDDDAQESRMLSLGTLRSDVEKGAQRSERPYDKIREKMALKYGSVAGAAADWKQKVKLSFA